MIPSSNGFDFQECKAYVFYNCQENLWEFEMQLSSAIGV